MATPSGAIKKRPVQMVMKVVAEITRLWTVPEYHFLGRLITRYAQLAHVSVPWMGSRPELVVKSVPMLAS